MITQSRFHKFFLGVVLLLVVVAPTSYAVAEAHIAKDTTVSVGDSASDYGRPLLALSPALKKAFEKEGKNYFEPFAMLPTPVKKLDQLGKLMDREYLFCKLDNNTSDLFGGNKVRKLEFLLADARAKGFTEVLTEGAVGSNHTVATAAHAQLLGLACHVFLVPQEVTVYLKRNLLLDYYFGAEVKFFGSASERDIARAHMAREYDERHVTRPYYIPVGGSNAIGALGYVNAALELKQQIAQGLVCEPHAIYVTLGSMGTAAGLVVGLKIAGLSSKVMAVRVSGSEEGRAEKLIAFSKEIIKHLQSIDPIAFAQLAVTAQDFEIVQDYAGDGYGKITPETAAAIMWLEIKEGIKLDGTYAGKTAAAFIHAAAQPANKNKALLLWDTFCAGNFIEEAAAVDFDKIAPELRGYFDMPVQELDQGC